MFWKTYGKQGEDFAYIFWNTGRLVVTRMFFSGVQLLRAYIWFFEFGRVCVCVCLVALLRRIILPSFRTPCFVEISLLDGNR